MQIKLPDDKRPELLHSLKRYFEENLDQDLGDLGAGLLLDYILAEFGPVVYNLAIRDAQKYFHNATVDLDSSIYLPENAYWEENR